MRALGPSVENLYVGAGVDTRHAARYPPLLLPNAERQRDL